MDPVVVVGAGISGVACARVLVGAGLPVRVLDRGRRIGGRMASRRLDGRSVDLGASYLTAGDERFSRVVADWHARGVARPWTDTFTVLSTGAEPRAKPGPLRWGAPGGLRTLVEDLAVGLEVEEGTVTDVRRGAGGLEVDGRPASATVLAMPDAQAQRLLGPGLEHVGSRLTRESDPVLALVARWADRRWDPDGGFDGAFVQDDPDLAWIADDGRRRGDGAPVLVAHSTPDLARAHLEDPAEAGPRMQAALEWLLGVDVPPVDTHVHRWSLARPTGTREDPFLLTDGAAPVGVCGDGWGPTPKVETAWLSGTLLGEALAARLS